MLIATGVGYYVYMCPLRFCVYVFLADQKETCVHAQKICKQFYPELTATLFSSDLSSYFVSKDIISMDDEELIDKATTNKEKAKIVLRIIFSHLEGGYIDSFKDMLDIMKNRGTKPVADLALKITSELKLS